MAQGKSRPGLHPDRPCEWCKKMYSPKRTDTRFCGTECQVLFARNKKKTETANRKALWQKKQSCVICGTSYMPTKEVQECCSPKCNDKKRKQRKKAANAQNLQTIERTCKYKCCTNIFKPKRRKDQVFCSKRCADLQGRLDWKIRNIEKVRKDRNRRAKIRYRENEEFRENRKKQKKEAYRALSTKQRQELGRRNRQRLDKENRKKYFQKYHKKRSANDLEFRLAHTLRGRVRMAIKAGNGVKSKPTEELLGCTIDEARAYIENLWLPGMSWENWTTDGWHIDHIRPCASFDLTDYTEQKKCFHFSNLQPLWAFDNLSKNDNWEKE